jgi:tRNA A37 threonylcarbamoyladenosine dehydratase
VLRRELAKKGIRHVRVVYSKESPIEPKEKELLSGEKKNVPASSPFVPPVAGIIIASEVIKDLLD